MTKIAVFDSGLDSISIIRTIQKLFKAEIIYFADQQNYPYGTKSHAQLRSIINKSIRALQTQFSPDILVMASNTPSLMLNISSTKIIDVKPTLIEAQKISKSKKIGILATTSAINSKGLSKYIKQKALKSFQIIKIDGSELVDLVESGQLLTHKSYCKKIIKKNLKEIVSNNSIDTITLSSTHLPFLKSLLVNQFPDTQFIDPGNIVAQKIFKKIKYRQSKRNSLKIYTSGDPKLFQKNLVNLRIKNKINILSI